MMASRNHTIRAFTEQEYAKKVEETLPSSTMMSSFLKRNPKNGKPMAAVARRRAATKTHGTIIEHKAWESEGVVEHAQEAVSEAPQIRIIDGRVVLDEESLITSRQPDAIHREHIEETNMRITAASFRRKKAQKNKKWTIREDDSFYEGLSVFGTDFSIISNYIPGKTREQIKSKFKREERSNPTKIRLALTERKSMESSKFNTINEP